MSKNFLFHIKKKLFIAFYCDFSTAVVAAVTMAEQAFHYSNFHREFLWNMLLSCRCQWHRFANSFSTAIHNNNQRWFNFVKRTFPFSDVQPQNISFKYFEIMVFLLQLVSFLRCVPCFGWILHKSTQRQFCRDIFSAVSMRDWVRKERIKEEVCNKGSWFCKFFISFIGVDLHQRRFFIWQRHAIKIRASIMSGWVCHCFCCCCCCWRCISSIFGMAWQGKLEANATRVFVWMFGGRRGAHTRRCNITLKNRD